MWPNCHVKRFLLAICLVALALPSQAFAQCVDWRAGPLTDAVEGTGGVVYASTLWDPDGLGGPLPQWLVVGGSFTEIGGMVANHVAAFDGAQWRAFGNGTSGDVYALIVQGADLIAGGYFNSAGTVAATNIARWTGGVNGAWAAIGTGLPDGYVSALAVYHSFLYAGGGGFLDTLPGVDGGLAKWSGTAWIRVGQGIWQTRIGGVLYAGPYVAAMRVYNDKLIIGGGFALDRDVNNLVHLAKWDETNLTRLGPIFGNDFSNSSYWPVMGMGEYITDLIVGGSFHRVEGTSMESVFGWTGTSARRMGTGLNGAEVNAYPHSLGPHCFANFQSLLISGGEILSTSAQSVSNLVRWNGTNWAEYAGGVTGRDPTLFPYYHPTVQSMTVYNDNLVVGGWFNAVGAQPNPLRATNIATFNPGASGSWSRFQGGADVLALAPLGPRMVAAGGFGAHDANGDACHNLIAWNGVATSRLGRATDRRETGVNGPVYALKSYASSVTTNTLIGGGGFTTAGLDPALHIASWTENTDGSNGSWSPMGAVLNNDVQAIELFNGLVCVTGAFTASGATPINHMTRWDGSAWQPFGSGLNATGIGLCLKAYTNNINSHSLLVGGLFSTANGISMSNIALYTETLNHATTGWSALGAGLNYIVRDVERIANTTYACGDFTASGGTPLAHVARFVSGAWQPLGTGLNGPAFTMLVEGGYLYVAGNFTSAGGVAVHNLARWDGNAWSDVGGGTDGNTFALAAFHNELHAGGQFDRIRNATISSPGWGRFLETGVPWIVTGPQAATNACGTSFTADVLPAEGYDGLQYHWRKNGVPLMDGPTGFGATISGATGDLTITNLGTDDQGMYDCVVSNTCGSVISNTATLTVTGCPPIGDMNCDRVFNNLDVNAFVMALLNDAAYHQQFPNCRILNGDANHDQALDGEDIEQFVNCLINGGCG